MKAPLYILFIAFVLCSSCGNNNKKEPVEQEQHTKATSNSTLNENDNEEDKNDLGSFLNDALEDGWEIDGESMELLDALNDLSSSGNLQIDEEALRVMLEKSGKTLEDFQSHLEKTGNTANSSDGDSSLSDLENMLGDLQNGNLDQFKKALEATGVDISEGAMKNLLKQNSGSGKRLTANNKEDNARAVLDKIYPEADQNLIEEEIMKPRTGMRYERLEMLEKLGNSNSKEEANAIMASFLTVSEEELLLLQTLPPEKQAVWSEKDAIKMDKYIMPQAVEAYLKSGKASPKFIDLVELSTTRRQKAISRFIRESKKAREKFFKQNPSWFTEGSTQGNTYKDQRNKYIFLPLGELSFADKVISHELGSPEGDYSEGAIGAPNMDMRDYTDKDPRVCNLGIKGVLTLEFTDNAITNVVGPDLYVFELGAVEPTNLEISKDGKEWVNVGKIEGGTALVDIEEFVEQNETFRYIRLTDLDSSSAVPGADVDAVAAIGGAVRLNIDSSVLFDTGKHNLKESAASELDKLVSKIEKFEKGMIVVEGHTDNDGNPKSNQALSLKRAKEVSSYLQAHLSNEYKFQQKGLGENQPIAPNDSAENKQKNRRVEILVLPLK